MEYKGASLLLILYRKIHSLTVTYILLAALLSAFLTILHILPSLPDSLILLSHKDSLKDSRSKIFIDYVSTRSTTLS